MAIDIEHGLASNLDRMFVRMTVSDGERQRLQKALEMAAGLLSKHFSGRLDAVVVDYHSYEPNERLLPLDVQAPFADWDENYLLEKELADKVLGPVLRDTRISLPVTISHAIHRPKGSVGLIFEAEG